jgi:hypothetical protein
MAKSQLVDRRSVFETCSICGRPIARFDKDGVVEELKKFDFDEEENTTVICTDCMSKPFYITSVCREDLLMEDDMFTPEEVAKFDDAMMQDLADKIGESTTGEAGTF